MQVLPLLTPTHFVTNNKKRPRPATEEFESHYLKKRLISTLAPLNATDIEVPAPLPETEVIIEELSDETPSNHSNIQLIDVNGTLLPMEQKPGETKYSIPDFVLKEPSAPPSNSKELVLYRKNLNLLTDQEESNSIENLDDNNSITSEEFDEEYDPMDVD